MELLKFPILLLFSSTLVGAGYNGTDAKVPYLTKEEFASVKGLPLVAANFTLPPELEPPLRLPSTKAAGDWLWPNAEVPYSLDHSLNNDHRREVAKAIQHFHDNTCIRFVPRESWHTSWVNIEYDPNVCGLAMMCRMNGGQWAKFGGNCVNAGVMVHELGHTLCLGHEQSRQDRDEWVSFDANKCSISLEKDSLSRGLHKLYDYVSAEHYETECKTGCIIPKEPGVTKCGSGGGLSVLDAELLNEVYGCTSGCHGIRWVNHNSDIGSAPVTAHDWNGWEIATCRAYFHGDIIPGKYRIDEKACYVAYGGGEHKNTGNYVEVMTDPGNSRLGFVKSSQPPPSAIKGGRSAERETIYAVLCDLKFDWGSVMVPGKWHNWAYAGFGGREHWCKDDFYFLTCG